LLKTSQIDPVNPTLSYLHISHLPPNHLLFISKQRPTLDRGPGIQHAPPLPCPPAPPWQRIPCVIWAEDALAHYGVPTVCFDLFLLVHDSAQATKCLTDGGFVRVGLNKRYKDIPRLDEGVPRFVDPAYRQLSLLSDIESCIAC